MTEISYEKYSEQGGDIGISISTALSLKYPDILIGLPLNYISGSYKPYIKVGDQVSEVVVAYEKPGANWYEMEGAYANMHSKKVLTLAH